MEKVKIQEVKYDGYERLYKLELPDKSNLVLWAHGIVHDQYIESGFEVCNETKFRFAEFRIEWVNEVNKVGDDVLIGFGQNIIGSSHIKCVGIVEEVIDNDTVICCVGSLGSIQVEFESGNFKFDEKNKIEFFGNLEVELQ